LVLYLYRFSVFNFHGTLLITQQPVLMAKRSEASTAFRHLNIGIAGSNPTQGMDVCLRLSVLRCPM
jgi:hypothetical protein